MTDGIYIYADDEMFEQFTVLCSSILNSNNSVEGIPNVEYPIIVLPHSENIAGIKNLIDYFRHQGLNISLLDAELHDTAAYWLVACNEFLLRLCESYPSPNPRYTHTTGNFSRFVCFDTQLPFDRYLMLDCDIAIRDPDFFTQCFRCLGDKNFLSLDHFFKMSKRMCKLKNPKHHALGHRDSHIFCVGAFGAKKDAKLRAALEEFTNAVDINTNPRMQWRSLLLRAPEQTILEQFLCNLPEATMAYMYESQELWTHGTLMECLYPPEARDQFVHWIGIPNELFSNELGSLQSAYIPHSHVFQHYQNLV